MQRFLVGFLLLMSLGLVVFGAYYVISVKKSTEVVDKELTDLNPLTSSSAWAKSMLAKYPYDEKSNTGIFKANFPDKVTIVGEIIKISEDQIDLRVLGKYEFNIAVRSGTKVIRSKDSSLKIDELVEANVSDLVIGRTVVATIGQGDPIPTADFIQETYE